MKLARTIQIAVLALVIGGLGAVGALVYQDVRGAPEFTIEASPSWTNYQYTTDFSDGHGATHGSSVNYSIEDNPTRVIIHKFTYGGRYPDSGFCWYKGKWKKERIEYWQETIGDPILRHTNGPGGWYSTPHTYLGYWVYDNPDTNIGATGFTKDWLRYKQQNWCGGGITHEFNGLPIRHYLNQD